MDSQGNLYAVLLSLLFGGCSGLAGKASSDIRLETIHSGTYIPNRNFTEESISIISSQAEYESSLSIYSYDIPVEIDFSNNTVLLADMGAKNTGGYTVEVASTKQKPSNDKITITVTFNIPDKSCIVTAALTNPFKFILIPTRKEIEIVKEVIVNHCN